MKPLTPDVQVVADFNASALRSRQQAQRVVARLLKDATRTEHAALMGFALGKRRALGVQLPRWAYQVVGALLLRYPPEQFSSPKERATKVLEVFRSRLIVALRLRVNGAKV